MPLISVIIPSYNHRQYVTAAIRSVLDSDYESIELIIIDDGSTDGSPTVIRDTIADHRGRHIVFVEQPNAGAHLAIMRGASQARGGVLTILNSDDRYDSDRFSTIMQTVPKTDDFIVFSQVRFIDEAGTALSPEAEHRKWYAKALSEAAECPTVGYGLLRNNFSVTSGNFIFTRSLYERVGGFCEFKLCHDWDFLIRAMHYVEPLYLPKPLMSYRVHQRNTVNSVLHLFLEEGVPSINSFIALGLKEMPPNPLAPGWAHWPDYFDYFINTYSSWFSDQPMSNFLRYQPDDRSSLDVSDQKDGAELPRSNR
jgi:glycosyltransferase involved in cell wall biosynthesis